VPGTKSTDPEIQIVGIYAPSADREQCERFIQDWLAAYGDFPHERLAELEQQLRAVLNEVVLVEVFVSNPDERFNVSDFLQPDPASPIERWQGAWREVFLSPDGDAPAGLGASGRPNSSCFRVAFYVHFWKRGHRLTTSYGDLFCPEPQTMPERLWTLAPYDLPY
jgi:hypothetical protein